MLPSVLSALRGLKFIDASNNEIDAMDTLDLPALAELNLAKNRLKTAPDVMGLRCLAKLTLSDNQLRSLPGSIGAAPSLRTLILDRNQLTSLPDFGGSCKLEVRAHARPGSLGAGG